MYDLYLTGNESEILSILIFEVGFVIRSKQPLGCARHPAQGLIKNYGLISLTLVFFY